MLLPVELSILMLDIAVVFSMGAIKLISSYVIQRWSIKGGRAEVDKFEKY